MLLDALVMAEVLIVLIETYWNVNEFMTKRMNLPARSINRNILECKFVSLSKIFRKKLQY